MPMPSLRSSLAAATADEAALLRRYHLGGDLEARRALVARMLPFVRHIARATPIAASSSTTWCRSAPSAC